MNDLRHRPNSALSLREPLTQEHLPAVQAVKGKEGIFLGKDYRGVEVLADLRPIPQSSWFMVAKVDTNEILAEVRYRGAVTAVIALFFLVTAAGVTAYLYRYRQLWLYQALYRSEREQREAQQEFRTTLYSIGDAVITTDTEGRVKQMNPEAERLTGWLETEARGRSIENVFRIVNEKTREAVTNPVDRVLREGVVVGLANHTLLISKDGSEHPIADSGAPIRDEGGTIAGVVLIFRDQTEQRAAYEALEKSEERFRRVSSISSDIAYSCSKTSGGSYTIDWITGAVERITGYSVDELKAFGCWRFLVIEDDLPVFDKYVVGVAPGGQACCELRFAARPEK